MELEPQAVENLLNMFISGTGVLLGYWLGCRHTEERYNK
jgi:hypothetical protein